MIRAILAAIAGGLDAITAWLKGRERKALRQAGIDQQKVSDHEANELSRHARRNRNDRIARHPTLGDRLRQYFHDPDSR